jgi:hypothetical protein
METTIMTRKLRRLRNVLVAGAALAAIAPGAAQASGSYTTLSGSGFSVPAGAQDIGNHCDDCTTYVALPFPVSIYGVAYYGAYASSNGNLQFTTNSTIYANESLPSANLGATLMPFWDDLRTDGGAQGIFVRSQGRNHKRKFTIEWRASTYNGMQPVDFAVVLTEGKTRISTFYGLSGDNGGSATAGIQDGAGIATQFSYLNPILTPGARVDYVFHTF